MPHLIKALWLSVWGALGPVSLVSALYLYEMPRVAVIPVAAMRSEAPVVPTIDPRSEMPVRPKALEVRFVIQNLGWRRLDNAQLTCENDITRFDVSLDAPNSPLVIPNTFSLLPGDTTQKSCYVRESSAPIRALLGFDALIGDGVIKQQVTVSNLSVLYAVLSR